MKQVAVIGSSEGTPEELSIARKVGFLLAQHQIVLLSGGRTGVMEASCQGSKEAQGITVGIVPGTKGNAFLDIIIKTNMGQARNIILIESSDAVIAIGGGHGTLSEIAFALKNRIPVFGLMTWNIPGITICNTAEVAVNLAIHSINSN